MRFRDFSLKLLELPTGSLGLLLCPLNAASRTWNQGLCAAERFEGSPFVCLHELRISTVEVRLMKLSLGKPVGFQGLGLRYGADIT